MFIQSYDTPNPSVMKFVPDGEEILGKGKTAEFKNVKEAKQKSDLAFELFNIEGVKGVFFGADFITITKEKDFLWEQLKSEILITIVDYLAADKPLLNNSIKKPKKNTKKTKNNNTTTEEEEIINQIKELIEIKIKPAVAMDGGDVNFREFKDGIVYLEMHGACSGCPSASITLKHGIENMLKHYIPQVEAVEQYYD